MVDEIVFNGKIGKLADGRLAIVRPMSADGRATMEVYDFIEHSVVITKYDPCIACIQKNDTRCGDVQ